MQSYIRMVHVCIAVTGYLHFWQNDRDLLHATAVTRGWNEHRNKSQHRKQTLDKKILHPFLHALEPGTLDHEPSALTTEPPLLPIPCHSRPRPTACNWILTYVCCRSTVTMTDATNATLRTSWRLETRHCRTVFTCKSEVSAKCCTTSLPIFIYANGKQCIGINPAYFLFLPATLELGIQPVSLRSDDGKLIWSLRSDDGKGYLLITGP